MEYNKRRSYGRNDSEKRFSKGEGRFSKSERGRRSSGEHSSFGGRKFARKPFGDKPAEGDKPYGRRKFGEDKPFEHGGKSFDRGRKPFDRDRKPSGERSSFGERKQFGERSPYAGRRKSDKFAEKPVAVQQEVEPQLIMGDEEIRLNRFIANSGICSRREADTFIQTGLVSVNGKVVTELGVKVKSSDDVRFNGQRLKGERKVYLVMNKPKGYATTLSDPHAEKTVMDLIDHAQCPERVYPVGRLDKNTTGVLMFTNDGELTDKLTHPSFGAKKIYHAFLDKNLKKADFDAILEGIELEDGEIHADALSYVDGDMAQVGVEIHSGRNRIVRRIFEHLGYSVRKLDRVYFAGLTKKALTRGSWRFLTETEIAKFKMGQFD